MGVNKAPLLKELMNGERRRAPHPENGVEGVGAGTQMLDGAEIFQRVALLLQRIIGRAGALQDQLGRLHLHRLLGVGRLGHHAPDNDGAAHVELGGGGIMLVRRVINDLQIADHRAVVQLHEGTGLHIAGGADPALQGHFFSNIVLRMMQDLFYRCNRHSVPSRIV